VYYMHFVHQGLLTGSAFTVRAQPLDSVADPHVMLPRVGDYACIDTVDTEAIVVSVYSQVSEEIPVW
jgi:hypothetical protein